MSTRPKDILPFQCFQPSFTGLASLMKKNNLCQTPGSMSPTESNAYMFANPPKAENAACRILPRHDCYPRCKRKTVTQLCTTADQCHDLRCRQHADTRYVGKALALLMLQRPGRDSAPPVQCRRPALKRVGGSCEL